MDYRREITSRNTLISQYQDKIKAIEAELDQLWRDEGIASVNQEVPLDSRGNPRPMLCRKCRQEPVVITKKSRQIDAIVEGRVTRVWQDYYLYVETRAWGNSEIWGERCIADFWKEASWISNVSRDNYC